MSLTDSIEISGESMGRNEKEDKVPIETYDSIAEKCDRQEREIKRLRKAVEKAKYNAGMGNYDRAFDILRQALKEQA